MEIKTLGQLLQEIVESEEKYFSLHEFLTDSTEEERKEIEKKLTDAESKEFYDFMDGFNFVSQDEVFSAVNEFYESMMNTQASMGEMTILYDIADDYIKEKGLNFED